MIIVFLLQCCIVVIHVRTHVHTYCQVSVFLFYDLYILVAVLHCCNVALLPVATHIATHITTFLL